MRKLLEGVLGVSAVVCVTTTLMGAVPVAVGSALVWTGTWAAYKVFGPADDTTK